MKTYFAATALVAALAQPATATTFPTLTTIYVITGVKDSGDAANIGTATAIQCSNVSGVSTSIRVLALSATGATLNAVTLVNVSHGATIEAATHNTVPYINETFLIPGTLLSAGVVNIESLQSAVFCTAMIVDAAASVPNGIDLHLVRVNAHPGTVE